MKQSHFVVLILSLVVVTFGVLYAKQNIFITEGMSTDNEDKEVLTSEDITPPIIVADSVPESELEMPSDVPAVDDGVRIILKTNMGDIRLGFFSKVAPLAVENFLKLAQTGFYDGVKFHRVIKDFMIQTGDPNSKDGDWSNDGQGDPGYTINDEFNMIPFYKGILGMAKTAAPNSGGSQFFIVTNEHAAWLDGQYTVFGRVLTGMDVITAIDNVETTTQRGGYPPDHPIDDVVIDSIVVEQ